MGDLKRKAGELPPHCLERDFVGVSQEALLEVLAACDGAALKREIMRYIRRYGATNNQRMMLADAAKRLCDAELSATRG